MCACVHVNVHEHVGNSFECACGCVRSCSNACERVCSYACARVRMCVWEIVCMHECVLFNAHSMHGISTYAIVEPSCANQIYVNQLCLTVACSSPNYKSTRTLAYCFVLFSDVCGQQCFAQSDYRCHDSSFGSGSSTCVAPLEGPSLRWSLTPST